MIIDFHTHIFPEKIAERAVAKLAAVVDLKPAFNGCAEELRLCMKKAGVDRSIVLPVVTDVKQFDSIFKFACFINETYGEATEQPLLSIGGIHPDDPAMKEHLTLLKNEGFRAVKIHPHYQGVNFNDIRIKNLLYTASELDLPVLTHAGFDPYTPEQDFCSPDMIVEVVNEVAPKNLILAHLGSNENYDEAEEKLCGLDVYLDTAYSILRVAPEQFLRMVRKHGADKILFATDCPWAHQDACVQFLKDSALTEQEKNLIFSENAIRLLKL
ncbi:MAG: amidohydrolase family protein [Clostridiales bacterium]|nr:amidohydrolase family protein [Candidatus Blautia equi]